MKAIIFDVMGVIVDVDDDINELLIPFVHDRNPKVSGEQIEDTFISASAGKMTSGEFWEAVGVFGNPIELNSEYLTGRFPIDKHFLPIANALKQSYKIGIVSNDISDWCCFLMDSHQVLPLVDAFVVSGAVGIRKPDAGIFKVILDRLGLSANQCTYVDDRIPNILAAKALGFRAILFNRGSDDYDGEQITSLAQLCDILPLQYDAQIQ